MMARTNTAAAVTRRQKANAIRALSMDAVQRARSGHPGAPMGMADFAEVLWCDFLRHNPNDPHWANRDRFVLSNGHASMLLYSLLHLSGYALSIDDLKNFRQLHSPTPGHPEYGHTPGVETTTGPLGQGLANAVGMALAERVLAAQFNRPKYPLVDHYTYACVGDGCLMEGVSHEACSLAGVLKLGKLIVLYDDNNISIDGEVAAWFGDDTAKRFESYGWRVIDAVDGHDAAAVGDALRSARANSDAPTLICCRTVIGWGSPNKAGQASSHGAPLGEDEVARARAQLDWQHPPFVVPDEIRAAWDARAAGQRAQDEWTKLFAAYQDQHPQLGAEFNRRMQGALPDDWRAQTESMIAQTNAAAETIATRKASQNALDGLGKLLPELIGGSADLTESNLTRWSGSRGVDEFADGNYIYFGVREFAMAAMINGIVLHRGFRAYGATFLVFSDYARNAIRLAALMRAPSIFVLTHDSIGLGEDGPTHQPIEHLASLRLIPNLSLWRPCDAVETAVAWRLACESTAQPFALALSRQALAHQVRDETQLRAIEKGGYVLVDADGAAERAPQLILIATGSEVAPAMQAAAQLTQDDNLRVRVVSMPSLDCFAAQSQAYRDSVLPPAVEARIVIEAGVSAAWGAIVGMRGGVVGVDRFGESAPAARVFEALNVTVDAVAACAREVIGKCNG